MATEQGFSNQKKKGKAQFKTIHSTGSDSFGTAGISKALYDVTLSDKSIVSISDVLGSDGQVQYWNIEVTAHTASPGNILRVVDGSLKNFEYEIVAVPGPDNLLVLPISATKPLLTDLVRVMNWVTGKADEDGNLIITSGPIKYVLDSIPTEVSKDSAVPANTKSLPVEDFAARASLVSVDNKLTTLNAKDFATSAKQDTGNSSLSSIDGKFTTLNAKDFATSAKQDTGNSSLSSIDGKFTTLNATDFATSAKQDTGNSSLSAINGKLQSNGVVDSGNSSVIPLGIGGVFTGSAFEVTNYTSINVNVASDVASATNGVKVEFSPDGTNWDHSHSTTYTAVSGVGYAFNTEFKYARVVYTNGGSAQAYFRLQTIFKSTLLPSSLYTLSQGLSSNMFAPLTRSIITGETTGGGGGYVNVKVNPSGALVTEATVSGSVSVSNFPATQAISAAALPLPSGASTLAEQQTQTTALGSLTETAPATDTGSSGINGRLQRIAQRLTSLIGLFPSSIGQKASSGSLSVVLSSDSQPIVSSGAITQIQKTVGLTAVRATVSGSAPSAARKKLLIKPSKNNSGSIYFGSSSVTTANGLEIIGPDRLEFLLDSSDYYLISDTAGQVVEIIEVV